MNFLAHLFLSGDDEELKIGNFIADSVKGKPSALYSKGIRRGIVLHRRIDSYTDSHPIVLKSIKRLRADHGKFAGIVVDICYDHFLSKNWNTYSSIPLSDYANDCYSLLLDHEAELPERVKLFLPHMIKSNWLYNYSTFDGIDKVFRGMSRRTPYTSNLSSALKDLWKDYHLYEEEFKEYFPQLIDYVKSVLESAELDLFSE